MKRIIAYGLLAATLTGCATPSQPRAEWATIYWLPFGMETFRPVTEETIECAAHHVQQVPESAVLEMVDAEALGTGLLDSQRIRAKAVLHDRTLVIDSSGNGWDGKHPLRFDPARLERLLAMQSPFEATAGRAKDCQ